jgi:hypothetical protein
MSNARQARWDEADLGARLCRALEIAERVLEFFAVAGYEDAESPEQSFRPEKPLAETAMLIYAASGARHLPDVARRIERIALLLAPRARSERVLLDMALHPTMCLHFAVPHILLTKLGYRDSGFDALLGSCMRSRARHGHERPPFASLEQRWLASLWTDVGPGRDWRADLRNSVLHRPMDILGGLREDGYAFTHLLMYCSDFGFRPSDLPRPRSVILGEASSLLAKCLDTEDYDLAGEVLMAWPLLDARWNAAATFGFRVLARIEDQIGVVPGGTTKADRLNRLDGRERTRYALGTAYHTAYVMGFVCAASLLPGRAPPITPRGRQGNDAFLGRLWPYLDRDQGHWQTEWSGLMELEQNALATLVLDIAIARQCRKREYKAVNELLALAVEHDMASTPLCAQAAELLERLAACSHAIQVQRMQVGNQRPLPDGTY